ncbi:NAD(P)-binding protein [Dichomitus squalens LYAD-421 SS1]|uniref:NAD(P)-binding protein n=2 Tax=Dichomitus squalens TaxID=114155 RepID=A0A4Q9N7E6_9APHY|nr:NAD(P)-binding protein [Dichomitus squalens LYAD-421 SS1]EJF58432.1 NAD(P)-binding protein [Dichomitus squalens LYAD-421 SS1]TBU34836.1 NAD(P)-binding protein [Dichomitus squalens]
MHILILGGTGPSGIELIQQALEVNHTVVVYARSPQKLPAHISSSPSVTVVAGDLTDREKLSAAMQGVQAVLSVLGPGPSHPSNTPLAQAYQLIIESMKQQNVKRLIAVGTPSMKDEHDHFSLIMLAMITVVATFVRNAYKDVVAIGQTIRAADPEELVWTIARVPILNDNEDRSVLAGYVGDGKVGTKLARQALAAFVLRELEENQWTLKAPAISSP